MGYAKRTVHYFFELTAAAVVGLLGWPEACPAAPTISNIGALPYSGIGPQDWATTLSGISGDGQVAVGTQYTPGGGSIVWNTSGSLSFVLPNLSSYSSGAGVNRDGSVIVGTRGAGSTVAYRVSGGVLQDLPTVGGSTEARGVSSDGRVVVGMSLKTGEARAFRWDEIEGMVLLPSNPPQYSLANGVSRDGRVTVGVGRYDALGFNHASAWVGGSRQDLEELPNTVLSAAQGVNADGSVVVGYCQTRLGTTGVRWVNGTVAPLGTPAQATRMLACSADGLVIAGYLGNTNTRQSRAVIWRPDLGVVDLSQYLQSQGTDVSGWTLEVANGVSDDGRTISGYGTLNGLTRGFVVGSLRLAGPACNPADVCGVGTTYTNGTVDIGPDGQLTIEDFLIFLSAFGDAAGCPGATPDVSPCNPADICGVGATYDNGVVDIGPDGELSIEDFLVFLSAFGDAAGCW